MRRRFAAVIVLAIAAHLHAGIRGTVMTADGKPIAGATVKAFAIETTQARNERLMSAKPERATIGTATTSSNGNFVLDAGNVAIASLQISATAYAPAFTKALGDDDVGAMVLIASSTKSGKVAAGGKPVAGVLLVWGNYETRSGDDGTYSVPEVTARANVSVFHPGFPPLLNQPADPQHRNYDVALSNGVPVSGIVAGADGKTPVPHAVIRIDGYPIGESDDAGAFTIARAPRIWKEIQASTADQTGARTRREGISSIRIILGNAARLSGSVRDTTAKAVAGLPLSLSRKDGGTVEIVLTDEKGNFTFPPTLAGSYRLTASHPSYLLRAVELSLPARSTTRRDLTLSHAGRISGRVIDDSGKPVAAAGMTVSSALSSGPSFFMAQPEHFSSPTGEFVLGGIDTDQALIVSAARRTYPTGKSEVLKLAPGELKRNVSIVVPAGITVSGKVIDVDRKPMAGVAVLSFEHIQQNSDVLLSFGISRSYDRADQLQTGSDGTFAFRVKEGMYDIAFRKDGFPVKILKSTAVKPGLAPLEITMEPGVEISGRALRPDGSPLAGASVNVFVQEAPSPPPSLTDANGAFVVTGLIPTMYQVNVLKQDESLGAYKNVKAPARDVVLQVQEGSHVGAIVVDADHAPVLDFQAGLTTAQVNGNSVNRFGAPSQSFHTDDGHFRLEHVRAGPYELTVSAPGYVIKRTPVKIEEGKDLDDIEVALAHGSSLTFHVTGPDGSPLSGVNIRENTQQGGMQMMDFQNMLNGSTTENGEVTFPDLEATDKAFNINKQGYVSQRKTVKVSGKETRVDIQLSGGKTVNGSVVDSNGSPVPEARVSAYSPALSGGSGAVSDANGNFRLEGLGSGRFTFSASKTGGSATLKDVDVDTLSGPIVLKMAAGGAIVGHVRGLTDRDYAGVTIQASGEGSNTRVTVDATGAFRIESVSGTVRLFPYLRSNGAQRSGEQKSVDVTPGSEVTADLTFAEGATIRGRITWGGKPTTSGSTSYIYFSSADPTVASNGGAQTDSEGRYEIPGLKPGKHDVSVSNASRRFRTSYIVTGSDTFDIDAKGSALRGRVIDAQSGDPIAGALINLQSVDARNVSTDAGGMLSDAGGTFSFDDVAEGQYRVSAQKDKYSIRIVDVTVPGDTSAIDVKLAKLDGLRFRVVDARDGSALPAGLLALDAAGLVAYRGNFEPDGEAPFVIPVSAGTYRVTIASWESAPQTLSATAPSPEIRVALRPGGKLSIRSKTSARQRARLVGADGEPVRLNIYNSVPEIIITEGLQQYDHVPAGSFTLQILDTNGNVQRSVNVTVIEGGAATIEI
jgi:protocatechuate 3,4-dioxygenase beta subunit